MLPAHNVSPTGCNVITGHVDLDTCALFVVTTCVFGAIPYTLAVYIPACCALSKLDTLKVLVLPLSVPGPTRTPFLNHTILSKFVAVVLTEKPVPVTTNWFDGVVWVVITTVSRITNGTLILSI